MYFVVALSALLCISTGATFMGNSLTSDLSGGRALLYANEYPTSEETQKRLVREPPLIKRGMDPFSIPSVIKEPPLKRADSYVYPSTNSQLSDRIPLREPPLKRSETLDDPVYVPLSEPEEDGYDEELPDAHDFNNVYWLRSSPKLAWRMLLGQARNAVSNSESASHSQSRAERLFSRIWH